MSVTGQSLALRLVAVGALAAAVNVPCGVWRAHLRRLSPAWFLSIHASIPVVIKARHSMGLPRWAIAISIGAAVLGQQIGVAIERRRLAKAPPRRQLTPPADKGGGVGGPP